jgi:hypothetical protein
VQDERTVMRLRLGIGAIGILLPLVLPLGNWIFAELRRQSTAGFWPGSMSGSYYTSTRNVFVGSLCALGVFLIGYRFDSRDDRWSTRAGLFAIIVALCPTAPGHNPSVSQTAIGAVHLTSAGVLLFALAMFCISSFRDPTTVQMPWVRRSYLWAGWLILLFLALAVVAGMTHVGDRWKSTYICESLSVWAFGAAWISAAFELGAGIGELTLTRNLLSKLRALRSLVPGRTREGRTRRMARRNIAWVVTVVAVALSTWISGALILPLLINNSDVQWGLASSIGVSAGALAALWGHSFAARTEEVLAASPGATVEAGRSVAIGGDANGKVRQVTSDFDLPEAGFDEPELGSELGGGNGGPREPGTSPPTAGLPDDGDSEDPDVPSHPADAELTAVDAQIINFWIMDAPTPGEGPLQLGHAYTGCFQVGADHPENISTGNREVPPEDIPVTGLQTTWLVWSTTAELRATDGGAGEVEFSTADAGHRKQWMARFELIIPAAGESEQRLIEIAPLTADAALIDAIIMVRDDVYRELTIELQTVASPPAPVGPAGGGTASEGSPDPAPLPDSIPSSAVADDPPSRNNDSDIAAMPANPQSTRRRPRAPRPRSATSRAARVRARRILPAVHTQLRSPYRWQQPRTTLNLVVAGSAVQWELIPAGDFGIGEHTTHGWTDWVPGSEAAVQRVVRARKTLEGVRELCADRENAIDTADLSARLARFVPRQDWSTAADNATDHALAAWHKIAATREMRALAYAGSQLFQAFFPQNSLLRAKVEDLAPGDSLRISWSQSDPSFLFHIPWALLYRGDVPGAGVAVDPQNFLGIRLRTTHLTGGREIDRALGPQATRAHLLYWGDGPLDRTGDEAREHERELASWSPLFLPKGVTRRKEELSAFLGSPKPSPVSLLYLFCQCTTGSGDAPVLRFGNTNAYANVLELMDIGNSELADQPLVFVNACATSAADPYFTNELQRLFLRRGCRAYIGSECKVPTRFAARFATAFFHFLYLRGPADLPMSAGEALAQARKFFWDEYRSLGGLYYSYLNDDRIFVAHPEEVAALRRPASNVPDSRSPQRGTHDRP